VAKSVIASVKSQSTLGSNRVNVDIRITIAVVVLLTFKMGRPTR
jgi:hypothetical protein